MREQTSNYIAEALADLGTTLRGHHIATILSRQDIAQRYHRSRIGAFWLTINMGLLIGAMAVVFGTLFRAPMHDFLPFLCVSIVLWGFISSSITEACTAFSSADGLILQVRLPLFVHVLRTLYRNALVLAHNILIVPFAFLAVGRFVPWLALLAVPGLILVTVNVLWVMLVVAVICTRYRDLAQIVQNLLQVMFFVTPLMWMPQTLPPGSSRLVLDFNPFFHLISIIRDPLLGEVPPVVSWVVAIVLAAGGWLVALHLFGRYRHRIPYWL